MSSDIKRECSRYGKIQSNVDIRKVPQGVETAPWRLPSRIYSGLNVISKYKKNILKVLLYKKINMKNKGLTWGEFNIFKKIENA